MHVFAFRKVDAVLYKVKCKLSNCTDVEGEKVRDSLSYIGPLVDARCPYIIEKYDCIGGEVNTSIDSLPCDLDGAINCLHHVHLPDKEQAFYCRYVQLLTTRSKYN